MKKSNTMDLLQEIFDVNKKFERVIVSGTQTGGRLQLGPDSLPQVSLKKAPKKGRDYAKKIQEEEDRAWITGIPNNADEPDTSRRGGFHDIDDTLSTVSGFPIEKEKASTNVYNIYDFSHRSPCSLPIEPYKSIILHNINTNMAVVIQGSTGCGKTTQVPQYILDDHYSRGEHCNIIVTQPRRLAAITVAKHVCKERNWDLGSVVGYQVGLNAVVSDDTRLLFCTTGVLLQKLLTAKDMGKFTHVILDEVHERDEDMDFTMMVVRKFMRQASCETKVILMSATMDPEKYRHYFSTLNIFRQPVPAPAIDLDMNRKKRSNFLVSKYYLCQLSMLGPLPEINFDMPGISSETYNVAFKLITEFDRLEQRSNAADRGAVLVFLPGIQEIEELFNMLKTKEVQYKWWVLPLHSTITTDEQERVFLKPPIHNRKIILSTNIAESSLTVPDIVYVIDFCLTKQVICDSGTNFCSLQVTWAAKTNCVQRAGRAGRVRDGRVYRLVPKIFYEDMLPTELAPEILRCPLDRSVLLSKLLNMGPPKNILALCLDPPDLTNIENTILMLKETGALLRTCNGTYSVEDGDITYLGYIMAKLPVDIHISKLIVLGSIFNVLEDCIIMGAALSIKSMFSSPFKEQMAAYQSRLTWADGSCSDCIAYLNAFKVWRNNHEQGNFGRKFPQREQQWAHRYFLQLSTLREVSTLVRELKMRLEKLNIREERGVNYAEWTSSEKFLVWRFVVAGAFYPNYFVRSSQGGQVDEKEALKLVMNRDPHTTIFLHGMPSDQPGELYVKTIKEALVDCGADMKVSFGPQRTSKVYVQFSRPPKTQRFMLVGDIPGKVSMPVYKAVKLRQLRIPITINIMEPRKAMERAKSLNLAVTHDCNWSWGEKDENSDSCLSPVLPSFDTSCIYFYISHIVDAGSFWACIRCPNEARAAGGWEDLEKVAHLLNSKPNKYLNPLNDFPAIGKVYAVLYEFNSKKKEYRRGQVKALFAKEGKTIAQVFFIDFGNTADIEHSKIMEFGEDLIEKGILTIPAQAFECVLSELRPSLIANPRGVWSDEALHALSQVKESGKVFGKIYSVVYGVVYLEVFGEDKLPFQDAQPLESVNQYFIRKQWAEAAEEGYQSKANHEMRVQASSMGMEINAQRALEELQHEYSKEWLQQKPDPELPPSNECYKWVTLRGPYSPLEMKMYALTHIGVNRDVKVDWSSVNSVLIDTDPQDPHERMLVAAYVNENADQNRLTLRNTSLLPNIHGLSSLICLVFAPTVEMRVNAERTRYIGALCGLGAGENNSSYFPDHDMEISFDTKITLQDLEDVNRLRYWMSQGLFSDADFDEDASGPVNFNYCQGKVREFFQKLIRTSRPSKEVELYSRPYFWNELPKEDLLGPGTYNEEDRAIYTLHWGVVLQDEPEPCNPAHLRMLHDIAIGNVAMPGETVECKLCDVSCDSVRTLHIHLNTQLHRERERDITPCSYEEV